MKKKIIAILVVTVLVISSTIQMVYAIPNNEESNSQESFFEVNNTQIAKGETLEMTINLDQISYNKFTFTLTSNIQAEDVVVDNDETEISVEDNAIVLQINKEEIDLDKITMYYQIPESLNINDKIILEGIATNNETTSEDDEELKQEIEITVIENNNQNEENNNGNTQNNNSQDSNNQSSNLNSASNMQNNTISMNNQNNNVQNATEQNTNTKTTSALSSNQMSATSGTNTVTYNGSSNNYLTTLSLEGYSFNQEFSKDKTTYFLTVENSVEGLEVNATAEDSSAKVCVYGNSDLQTGSNKILVSVTSESGAVRTYRIYVTKK